MRELKEDKLPIGSTLNAICISTIEPPSSIDYGVSVDKYGSSLHSSQISRESMGDGERGEERELKEDKLPTGSTLNTICVSAIYLTPHMCTTLNQDVT